MSSNKNQKLRAIKINYKEGDWGEEVEGEGKVGLGVGGEKVKNEGEREKGN